MGRQGGRNWTIPEAHGSASMAYEAENNRRLYLKQGGGSTPKTVLSPPHEYYHPCTIEFTHMNMHTCTTEHTHTSHTLRFLKFGKCASRREKILKGLVCI